MIQVIEPLTLFWIEMVLYLNYRLEARYNIIGLNSLRELRLYMDTTLKNWMENLL